MPAAIRIADQAAAGWPLTPWRPLHACLILFAVAVSAAVCLGLGALVFADDPTDTVDRALRNFAAPTMVGGWLAVAVYLTVRDRIAASTCLHRQLLWLALLSAAVVAVWIGVIHSATWLEWQSKRTPTVYGSEWFYAEVYMFYVRETEGRLITATTALTLGLPTAWLLVRSLWAALIGQKKARTG